MKKYFYLILLLTGLCFGQQQTGGVNIPTGFHLQDNQHLDDRENTVATVADLQNIHNKVDGLTCKVTATPGKLYLYDEPTNTWSVIGGSDINHTGLFVNYTAPFDVTVGAIHTFVNQNNRIPSGSFTVTETTKPVYIIVTENLANGSSKKYTYAFIGGTGTWGNSSGFSPTGTATTAPMFTLIGAPNSLTNTDISNDPNTQTISLGNLPTGDYVAAANSVIRDLSNDNLVYYFSYTQDSVLYLVQFIGTNGIYGGSGTQLVSGDFAASTNSGVTPAQGLPSVLDNDNTSGSKDIRMTKESGIVLEGSTSELSAKINLVDSFLISSNQPSFQWLYNGTYRNIGRSIDGENFDSDGNFDLSGHLSGQFIPLTGTTEDNPVTGSLEFQPDNVVGIFQNNSGGVSKKYEFQDDDKILESVSGTYIFSREVSTSGETISSTDPSSNGISGSTDFTPIAKLNPLAYLQTKGVQELITAHTDIPDDFYIGVNPRAAQVTYKTDTYRTFDLPALDITVVNLNEIVRNPNRPNDLVIIGNFIADNVTNAIIITLKDCHIINNIFTPGEITSSEIPINQVHGVFWDENEFIYCSGRTTFSGSATYGQKFLKINPYDLTDYKTITLPVTAPYTGSVTDIIPYKDYIYTVITAGVTEADYVIRIDKEFTMTVAEVVFTCSGISSVNRIRRDAPFQIYNDEIYIATFNNSTVASGAYKNIGIVVYDILTGALKRSNPAIEVTPTGTTQPFTHWMSIFNGKIIVTPASGQTPRWIVRVDASTLAKEESISDMPNRFTDDNSIFSNGYMYLNEEAYDTDPIQPPAARLLKVKYNDFTDLTVEIANYNGGYGCVASLPNKIQRTKNTPDLSSILATNNTANNSINLVATSGTTSVTTGAINVSYTAGGNTVSGALDTSGLTIKTSPTGVEGKISSGNLTGTAKAYQLANITSSGVIPMSVSVNGGTPVTAGTNGNIDITVSGGGGGATNYPKILVLDTAPATYTGTSTQTILKVHTIPANTLSAGVLSIKFIFSNTGVAGTKAVMCYIGNSNTLPSTQYGRITPSATGRFHEITRDLIINASGVITASNAAASAPTDEAINGSAKTTISGLNFTQPIYIFSTVTLANPADDMTQESAEIIFKPQQ